MTPGTLASGVSGETSGPETWPVGGPPSGIRASKCSHVLICICQESPFQACPALLEWNIKCFNEQLKQHLNLKAHEAPFVVCIFLLPRFHLHTP